MEHDADRLAACAATYPYRSKERWREAEAAYQWSLEPGIDQLDALRRWELVVHMVHNFKSQVLLDPIRDWDPLPAAVRKSVWANPLAVRSQPNDLFRAEIVAAVVGGDYRHVGGIGLPIASPLCVLVSRDYGIVDRFSRGALAGLTSGSRPIWEVDVSYAAGFADASTDPLPELDWDKYRRYLETFGAVPTASGLPVREVERAMFRFGQGAQTESTRSWGGLSRPDPEPPGQ